MKNTVLAIGVLAVALLGVIAFTTKDTDAYQGDYTQVGPNHTQEREAEMEKIFESKDYEAWVKIMTQDGRKPGVLNKIDTQEEFELFVQARELALEGDTDGANAIRAELGLGQGSRNGGGQGSGMGNCNR